MGCAKFCGDLTARIRITTGSLYLPDFKLIYKKVISIILGELDPSPILSCSLIGGVGRWVKSSSTCVKYLEYLKPRPYIPLAAASPGPDRKQESHGCRQHTQSHANRESRRNLTLLLLFYVFPSAARKKVIKQQEHQISIGLANLEPASI